jgi:hypothetical protein
VLDKVDVRIPDFAQPGPAIAEALAQLKEHPIPPFRPTRFYKYACDCREPFDVDAVVHLELRHGRPTHKVEIVDAGKKSVAQMAEIVAKLFDVDPFGLGLMRVDLAADVEGVPVQWFRDHAHVNRKQFSSRIEKSHELEVQFVGMGNAIAQTLYAGKRPNLVRIYNKLAEWFAQLSRLENQSKRFNKRMEGIEMSPEQDYYGRRIPPTFREYCRMEGYQYQPGSILTRIERQIGGGRIPPELATFNDLRYAHELDPFAGLTLVNREPIRQLDAPPKGVPLRNWLAALGLEVLQERSGSVQVARSIVLKHANGNGKRILKSLDECLPKRRDALTMEEIRESFRKSTLLQTSNLG